MGVRFDLNLPHFRARKRQASRVEINLEFHLLKMSGQVETFSAMNEPFAPGWTDHCFDRFGKKNLDLLASKGCLRISLSDLLSHRLGETKMLGRDFRGHSLILPIQPGTIYFYVKPAEARFRGKQTGDESTISFGGAISSSIPAQGLRERPRRFPSCANRLPLSLRGLLNEADAWLTAFTDARPFTTNELFTQLIDVQGLISWTIRSSRELLVRSYGVTAGILGGVLSLVLSLFISGYMVADSRTLIKNLTRLLPTPWDERILDQIPTMGQRIGGYLRGRFVVSALLSIATSVGLSFIGLKDLAVGLGAIAGVTNLIPFLGPILGAVPALLVSIPQGGWTFLWVLLLYVVAQNLETYILDPLLVGSSVGVHPLYQLLAVLGGVQVLGIIGALIVPPWIAGAAVLLENLYLRPKLVAERRQRRSEGLPELAGFQADG